MQNLFDLSNDVAVVTGAGRGIGEGIACTLAGAGAAVVCAARRTDEVERVAAGIRARGGRALAVAAGHAMLGVTLAPATAEAVADLLTTGEAPPVLRPFDPGRFGRGRR